MGGETQKELEELLAEVPEETARLLVRFVRGLRQAGGADQEGPRPSGAELVDAVDAGVGLARWCDGALTELSARMATTAGRELLGMAGVAHPGEFSRTRRERWRAEAKSVTANELQALTGWGIQECHDRVGIALAPAEARGPAMEAMAAGWADFRAVRRWWRRCHDLPVPAAAQVAGAVLGPRVDPEGEAVRRSFAELCEVLEREARRSEGDDPDRDRARRAAALDRRTATAVLEDNGTGFLSVDGPASAVAAAQLRLDRAARRLRDNGDERTLGQLRADTALALLVHGNLPPLPEHGPPEGATGGAGTTGSASASGASAPVADPGDQAWQVLQGLPPVALEVIVPLDALLDPDSRAVGDIRGFGPITAAQARELALTPGTTIHRLLTDPADGSLLERSTHAYQPDAARTAQIVAADGGCRGPGCTHPPSRCERDHEEPYDDGSGGPTTPANLNLKHGRHHWLKTRRFWHSQMRADRTVTWETFFGRRYLTRGHDYRSYDGPPGSSSSARAGGPPTQQLPGELPWGARDALVYAALAHRSTGETLAALDDTDDPLALDRLVPDDIIGRGEPLELKHRTTGGAIRPGPPPRQPTPARIVQELTRPRETQLRRR